MIRQMAFRLLKRVIVNSTVYKYPDHFKLRRDTYSVESFNITLNVYEDKKIAFGSEQYKVRAFLETQRQNDNVNRKQTSISFKTDTKAHRRLRGEKNNKKKTFNF